MTNNMNKYYDENALCNIYVANLGKYNEGELVGGWLALPADDETIETFLAEVVGLNEQYEEYAIHDYESEFIKVSEYDNIEELNENVQELEDAIDKYGDCVEAAFEAWGEEALEYNFDNVILYPDVNNEYDLGYYYVEEFYSEAMKDNPLANYIDYEAYGRDIDMDGNGAFTSYGYVQYIG